MKVIAHTGLVPVRALRRFRNRSSGSVFGVEPKVATQALKDGDVELVAIRSDMETVDYGFDPEAVAPEPVVVADHNVIEIPADWRTAHGAKRAMLAKKILGLESSDKLPVAEGEDIGDFAIAVIEAELAKRAGADDAPASEPGPADAEVTNSETSAETPSA